MLQRDQNLIKPQHFSVVVCCRNAQETITKCLQSIVKAGALNIIIVDGNSEDKTRELITREGLKINLGKGQGLPIDRQYGVDLSNTPYTFFVDADHVVEPNFFNEMLFHFKEKEVDVMQSKLRLLDPKGVLNKGEDDYYQVIHNVHTDKRMLGLAPIIFKTENLKTGEKWEIVSPSSKSIDDTSWAKRASDRGAVFAVDGPEVFQIHSSGFKSYLNKFRWYGKGDAEFILEFPSRTAQMLFHLSIRYPFVYGIKMLRSGKSFGVLYVFLQGVIRLVSCLTALSKSILLNKIHESLFNRS